MKDYIEINKKTWNDKVAIHVDSEFYEQQAFLQGNSSLKSIELDLLGDVSGKNIIHLQCHFGQDSLSLTRMGAYVTGVDFSDKAIETAQNLAKELQLDTKFICCDVYETLQHTQEKYDIVFASYGVIGWLPDLTRWAELIKSLLKPGGRLVFVEFHPFVWTMDENFDYIKYCYFNTEDIEELGEGTYADRYAAISNNTISWNHPFSEVLQSLLDAGLTLTKFQEFDYSPFNCFNKAIEIEKAKFQIKGIEGKLPMVYALEAINNV